MASTTPGYRSADRSARSHAIDLYDYVQGAPAARAGRPVQDDLSGWRVVDDWPDDVPVTPEEVDVFVAWFGDIFDELFGPR